MRKYIAAVLAAIVSTSAFAAEPLKLWHSYRGAEEEAVEKSVRLFEDKTGIKVDILSVPNEALGSKLTTAIPHDVGPDVFIFAHDRLLSFAEKEMIAPSEGEIDKSAYLPSAVPSLEINGKAYGYPLAMKVLALYVNTKLVPETPATTDELIAFAKTFSNEKEKKFALAYESGNFYYHSAILFGFGAQLFDEKTGKPTFQTDGMTKSFAFVKELQDKGYIPAETDGAKVATLFNDGSAAMAISGPWFLGDISKDVHYAVMPLPVVSSTGLPMRPFAGVETAFVSAHSTQMKNAQALAKFLSLGEAALLRTKLGRQIPANLDAYADPEVQNDVLVSSFKDAAKNAIATPNTLEMQRLWEPMKLALHGVLQGTVPPEGGGALAERRYKVLNRDRPAESSPWPFVAIIAVAAGIYLFVQLRNRPKESFRKRYPDARRAVTYVMPAVVGLSVLVIIPFIVGIGLAFFHHEPPDNYSFVGLGNFIDILSSHGYSITEPLSFYFTLVVTIGWALINVVLHVSIGLFLALLLRDPLLKLRGLYRVLLIIPWAVPNYITALLWKRMFDRQFGAINGFLVLLGIEPISWFTHFSTAFAANVATNTWLGFPFMMVVALGALQSIPSDLYEAAEVDGASKWTQFKSITLPLLRPALLPAVILGSVWTFNMFNIIYLVSGGEPGGGTDILVSEAYRWAFERNEQYGFAAAYSVLIFFVLLTWSTFTKRLTKGTEEMMG